MAAASDPAQLKNAKEDIKELLKTKFCYPILVRRIKKKNCMFSLYIRHKLMLKYMLKFAWKLLVLRNYRETTFSLFTNSILLISATCYLRSVLFSASRWGQLSEIE